ncbi:MAG: hypothetical protein M3419_07010 [Actinomycetota bacterium]|nr:hypothetical protein [Actinomycetota bacterium]
MVAVVARACSAPAEQPAAQDVLLAIFGPRTGKTTALAVPNCSPPLGAAIATTNKRDLIDTIRDLRAAVGRVGVRPQQIHGEQVSWW